MMSQGSPDGGGADSGLKTKEHKTTNGERVDVVKIRNLENDAKEGANGRNTNPVQNSRIIFL